MAKTYLAGEAAVKLTPNSKGFHHATRRELAAQKVSFAVELEPNSKGFTRKARERLRAMPSLKVDVELEPDITGFRKKAQAKIDAGKRLSLKVAIEAALDKPSVATAHALMQAQIDAMGPITARLKLETTRATADFEMFHAMAQSRDITVNVNANTTGAAASIRRLRGGANAGGSGSSGIMPRRAVRKTAIGAGITFAPIATQALVGGLAAVTGAASQAAGAIGLLPAAATAAGAGIAALAVGMNGIAGAFQAASAASAEAKTADNSREMASAARAITSAERGVLKAQEATRRAQDDLNKARKQAVRDLRDMNDELRLAPLNEREAALAIKEAQKRLMEAYSSGDSLEIEGASIDLEQSKIQADILRKQNQDLAADTREANLKGVEGADAVVDAKQGIVDANDALLDAQDQLTSAIEQQTEALNAGSAAADKYAEAMAKLAPNARAFVEQMRALGPQWTELRKAVQDRLFEGLGDSVTNLANAQLPTLRAGLEGISILLNRGMRDSMEVFSSDAAVSDFNETLGNTQLLYAGIANTAKPLSQAWIDIVTVGSTFLPRLGTALTGASAEFGSWISEMRETGQMQAFFEKSIEMAKQLGRIISNVAHIIGDFFSAGAETGGGMLNTFEGITRTLRDFTESLEGQTAMKEFFTGVSEAVRTLSPILTIVAKTIFDTLGPALTDFVIAAGPGIVDMFEGLRVGLQAIAPVMTPLGEAFGVLGNVLGNVFEILGPVIADTLSALIPAMAPLIELFGTIIAAVAPVLPLIGELIGQLVGALAPAFTKIVEALAPVITSLIDALMPVIPPLAAALGQVAGVIADALVMAIQAMAPFLPMIINAFVELVIAILPLIDPLMNIAMQLMPSVIQVFEALMPIVLRVIQVLVDLVNYLIPVLIPVLNTLGDIVGFVFGLIADVISWALKEVVDPLLTAITATLNGLGTAFNWLYNEVILPVWGFIVTTIKDAKGELDTIFGGLETAINWIGTVFDNVAKGIGTAWDKIKEYAAGPINWVIDYVINGALKSAWNAVASVIPGLEEWDGVARVDPGGAGGTTGMGGGGGNFYNGGIAPGYTPGRDPFTIGVSGGEAIMRPEFTRAVGAEQIHEWNGVARRDGVAGLQSHMAQSAGMFANGGVVDAMTSIVQKKYPMLTMSSGLRPGDPGMHGSGLAADFSNGSGNTPEQLALAQDIAKTYPGAAELIYDSPGWAGNIKNGQNVGAFGDFYTMAQAGNHKHHVHWGMTGPPNMDFDGGVFEGGSNGGGAGGGGLFGALRNKAADTFNSAVSGIGDNMPDFGPSMMGQIPKNFFDGVTGKLTEWIRGSAGSGGGSGPDGAWEPSAGAEQWRQMMIDAYKNQGYDPTPAKIDAWVRQIDTESGGNPNIAQQIVDVNGTGEAAGVGLGQMIPGTWQGYRDPSLPDNRRDPWAMTNAMVRYGEQKYGDNLLNMIGQGHGYDQGGVASGVGFMPKMVIEPERVLSPGQTAAFEAMLPLLQFLIPGLKALGANDKPLDVNVDSVAGMPTTADTGGRDVITGEAYGQPLQGAAIDANTGEYLPANNVTPTDPMTVPFQFKTDGPEWKTAKSLASVFGFGGQMDKIESKAEPINGILAGAAQAAPAYAAAIAGDPTALMAQIGQTTTAWAAKTATDFSNYVPENAGGMLESVLSMAAGPLIGSVSTGMSSAQLIETMEDVDNRKARRTKTGRSRRA